MSQGLIGLMTDSNSAAMLEVNRVSLCVCVCTHAILLHFVLLSFFIIKVYIIRYFDYSLCFQCAIQ